MIAARSRPPRPGAIESLRRQRKPAEARQAEQRLARAWATADLKPAAGS